MPSVRRARRPAALLAALALALSLSACSGSDDAGGGGGGDDSTLTVFAAASLTGTFTDLATQFEAAHEGVDVQLSFSGSSDLVAQIQQGAGADVFASADAANMDKLTAGSLVGTPVDFASNTLEIAVPPGNPAKVQDLADLGAPGLNLVVCAPEVPCGAAAEAVAKLAGVTLTPVSEEQKVTDVLTKVSSGEADAGLVYRTDVLAAGEDVEGVPFAEAAEVVNDYPISIVSASSHTTLAQQFIDLVTGAEGQSVLRAAGFAPAP